MKSRAVPKPGPEGDAQIAPLVHWTLLSGDCMRSCKAQSRGPFCTPWIRSLDGRQGTTGLRGVKSHRKTQALLCPAPAPALGVIQECPWNEGLFSGNLLESRMMKQMIGKNISQAMDLCSPCCLPKRCFFWGTVGPWNGWATNWVSSIVSTVTFWTEGM